MLKFYRTMVAFTFVIGLGARDSALAANNCACRLHSAQADGVGTCSRAEDSRFCTIEYSLTQPEEYWAFQERLREVGLGLDPRDVLNQLNITPPELWADRDALVRQVMPTALAISLRTLERLGPPPEIRIEEVANVFGADFDWSDFLYYYTSPGTRWRPFDITSFGFEGFVSYGCIELWRGGTRLMVKTPFSASAFYCNFEEPEWTW